MTIAKKTANPPAGFKIAYCRKSGESEWTRFGVQARAPAYLERCAALDPDVWMQSSNGLDTIYVRAK